MRMKSTRPTAVVAKMENSCDAWRRITTRFSLEGIWARTGNRAPARLRGLWVCSIGRYLQDHLAAEWMSSSQTSTDFYRRRIWTLLGRCDLNNINNIIFPHRPPLPLPLSPSHPQSPSALLIPPVKFPNTSLPPTNPISTSL